MRREHGAESGALHTRASGLVPVQSRAVQIAVRAPVLLGAERYAAKRVVEQKTRGRERVQVGVGGNGTALALRGRLFVDALGSSPFRHPRNPRFVARARLEPEQSFLFLFRERRSRTGHDASLRGGGFFAAKRQRAPRQRRARGDEQRVLVPGEHDRVERVRRRRGRGERRVVVVVVVVVVVFFFAVALLVTRKSLLRPHVFFFVAPRFRRRRLPIPVPTRDRLFVVSPPPREPRVRRRLRAHALGVHEPAGRSSRRPQAQAPRLRAARRGVPRVAEHDQVPLGARQRDVEALVRRERASSPPAQRQNDHLLLLALERVHRAHLRRAKCIARRRTLRTLRNTPRRFFFFGDERVAKRKRRRRLSVVAFFFRKRRRRDSEIIERVFDSLRVRLEQRHDADIGRAYPKTHESGHDLRGDFSLSRRKRAPALIVQNVPRRAGGRRDVRPDEGRHRRRFCARDTFVLVFV